MEQFDIFLMQNTAPREALPETAKSAPPRPRVCVLISPREMNENIETVIVAPMTTTLREYPSRVRISLNGTEGWVVLDQIRVIDKKRMARKIGRVNIKKIEEIKKTIKEMFVE
jgi:mRNA interferase MazF